MIKPSGSSRGAFFLEGSFQPLSGWNVLFSQRYGAWRSVIERTLFAFLDCGVEERGLARVCCDACRRDFRVALSCERHACVPRSGIGLHRSVLRALAARACAGTIGVIAFILDPAVVSRSHPPSLLWQTEPIQSFGSERL